MGCSLKYLLIEDKTELVMKRLREVSIHLPVSPSQGSPAKDVKGNAEMNWRTKMVSVFSFFSDQIPNSRQTEGKPLVFPAASPLPAGGNLKADHRA